MPMPRTPLAARAEVFGRVTPPHATTGLPRSRGRSLESARIVPGVGGLVGRTNLEKEGLCIARRYRLQPDGKPARRKPRGQRGRRVTRKVERVGEGDEARRPNLLAVDRLR